jgi:hypothetical protein
LNQFHPSNHMNLNLGLASQTWKQSRASAFVLLGNNEGEEAIHPELACIPIPNIRTMSLKFTIIGRAAPSTLSPSTNKGQEQQLGGGPQTDNHFLTIWVRLLS